MNEHFLVQQYIQTLQQWLQKNKECVIWGMKRIDFKEKEKYINVPSICCNLGIIEFATIQQSSKFRPMNQLQSDIFLHLASTKNTSDHTNAILKLLQGYPKVKRVIFLDCEINIQVLMKICKTSVMIYFTACRLGNAALFMQNFTSTTIRHISISSDTFGNKGLKKILSLNIPLLISLQLKNTNITTECIKTFNKQFYRSFLHIEIKDHTYFNSGQFIKNYKPKQPGLIASFDSKYQESFIYINYISKFSRDHSYIQLLSLKIRNKYLNAYQSHMVSAKAFNQLKIFCKMY